MEYMTYSYYKSPVHSSTDAKCYVIFKYNESNDAHENYQE